MNGFDLTNIKNFTRYFWDVTRSLDGALQYLIFIRPDIAFAVHQICLYIHDRRVSHLYALKCILRYLRGTLDLGIRFNTSSTQDLIAYSDHWGDAKPLGGLHLGIESSLAEILSHGRRNDRLPFPALVSKRDIEGLLTPLPRHPGYAIC